MPARYGGDLKQTAPVNGGEGGDDVKSAWPLYLGLHTSYNGLYNGDLSREVRKSYKAALSSDCRLKFACMKVESLVIAGQHTAVNTSLGLVHTARQATRVGSTRNPRLNRKDGSAEGESDKVD